MKIKSDITKRVIESIILSMLSISAISLKRAYYSNDAVDLTSTVSMAFFIFNIPALFLLSILNTLISKVFKKQITKLFKIIWIDLFLSTIFLMIAASFCALTDPVAFSNFLELPGKLYSIAVSTQNIRSGLVFSGIVGPFIFGILLIVYIFTFIPAGVIHIVSEKKLLLGQGVITKTLFLFSEIQKLFLSFLLILVVPGFLYVFILFAILPFKVLILFYSNHELAILIMSQPIDQVITSMLAIFGISWICWPLSIFGLVSSILIFNWIIQKLILEINPQWKMNTVLFSWAMRIAFFLTDKIAPYSMLGIILSPIQSLVIYSFCISGKKTHSLFRSEQCRKILTSAISENVLHSKSRWGSLLPTNSLKYSTLKQRLAILSFAGEVMFELGDLNRANLFYNGALEILTEAKKASIISNYWKQPSHVNSLDSIVGKLSDFYLKTEQDLQALTLQALNADFHDQRYISLLVFLSTNVRIRSKFDFDEYMIEQCNYFLSEDLREVDTLFSLIESLKLNMFNCKSPAEYDLLQLSFQKVEDRKSLTWFCEANIDGFSCIMSSVKTLFYRQNSVYAYFNTGSTSLKLTSSDLDSLLSESMQINTFGTEVSFPNPFFRDNLRIIPLILLETRSSHFAEKISSLMKVATQNVDNTYLAFLNCCYGKWLVDQGSVDEGAGFLEQGLFLYENIRNTINTDQMGTSFGSRCLTYYDWAIDALSSSGQHEKALEYAEASQARALLDLISGRTTYSSSTSHPKAREIFAQIQDADLILGSILMREQSSRQNQHPSTAVNPFKKLSASSQKRYKKSVQIRRSKLVTKLDQVDPVFSSLASFRPLIWRSNQTESQSDQLYFNSLWSEHILGPNHAILNFHVIHDFNGLNATSSWAKIVIFSLFEIEGVIHNECTTIESAQTSELEAVTKNILSEIEKGQTCKSLVSFSGILLLPVIKALPKTIQSITICANSDLQFIPWAACYAEKSLSLTLIDRYTLRSVPSLSLLYLLKKREEARTPSISQSLVAGIENYPDNKDYLFWSGFETNKIAEIYRVSPLKDKDVDEQFSQQFKDSQIIHYSGHGGYLADSESDSLGKTFLSFYEQSLSSAQILSGSLESSVAKVMVLSACLTGRGDITVSGSEVLGLERALFHAGLSALITTLWSVSEFSTALLMVKFHRLWFDRNNSLSDLSLCLGEAQVWMKTVTWKGIQEEFPDIEHSIQHCADRLDSMLCALKDLKATEQNSSSVTQVESQIYYYRHQVLPKINNQSTEKPFQHPRFWAAFQVKGLG
jgi:CHAT domain-containing protein